MSELKQLEDKHALAPLCQLLFAVFTLWKPDMQHTPDQRYPVVHDTLTYSGFLALRTGVALEIDAMPSSSSFEVFHVF